MDSEALNIAATLADKLDCEITAIDPLVGGRNARVYKLDCGSAGRYVTKHYFRDALDGRDRLGVEFRSLQFLWDRGVRCIPQPVLAAPDLRYAVYEYVEGENISAGEVTDSDIDEVVEFLALLHQLKNDPDSAHLPLASEACFSIREIAENIHLRFEKLISASPQGPHHDSLHGFLRDRFRPALEEITDWCRSRLRHYDISYDAGLGWGERTLSPSDFGFHNALRRRNGRIAFLDFEYFGWDHPAKMASDFLLHPGMDLAGIRKRRFVDNFLNLFQNCEDLAQRLPIVYPVFGLKWCLILLNEFVLPDRYARRTAPELVALQASQLEKSIRLLGQIKGEYERFSYYG